MSAGSTGTRHMRVKLAPQHLPKAQEPAELKPLGFFGWIKEMLSVILVAAIISALLRAFVFQVFWIPSPSMRDTLVEHDKIVVSRIDAWTGSIQRGDVVVFHDELGWLRSSHGSSPLRRVGEFFGIVPAGDEQTLVKRVIGVGGDRVSFSVETGRISVNGVPIEEPYIAQGQVPSTIPFDEVVPEGTLWVMGDNRGNSADSRYHRQNGESPFVPVGAVVGTVKAVILPLNRAHWGLSAPEVFSQVK